MTHSCFSQLPVAGPLFFGIVIGVCATFLILSLARTLETRREDRDAIEPSASPNSANGGDHY